MLTAGQTTLRAQLFLASQRPSGDAPAAGTVAMGWNPSPDPRATGYYLCWGLSAATCTNALDVGNATNATVAGLVQGVTYYFAVTAYDAVGDSSPPSNEISYSPPPPPAPTLNLRPSGGGSAAAKGLSLSFGGNPGLVYYVLATQDFQNWSPVCITNCTSAGLVSLVLTDAQVYSRRFYRLAQRNALSLPPAPKLTLQPLAAQGFAGGMAITFPGSSGMVYYLQATEDLQNWSTLSATNCTAAGPISFQVAGVAAGSKQFYRLVQQ